jgi:hypothetical protein
MWSAQESEESHRTEYWCSGMWYGPTDLVINPDCVSGVLVYPGYAPAPHYPKCEYCGTCAVDKISNCASCGAPLPWS